MTFCPNCGNQAAGSFCPNCGTALGGGAASGGAANAGSSGYIPQASTSGLSNNIVAALCYVFGIVGGIVVLLIEPYNKNSLLRFHAFQSIFLTLAWIVIGIAIGIIAHGLAFLLWPLYQVLSFVVWIYMIVTAYQGKKVMLPVIGELAQKQA